MPMRTIIESHHKSLTFQGSDERLRRHRTRRVMEYSVVKDALKNCPLFQGLGESSMAYLFWRAEEATSVRYTVIYAEGTACDDSFGLLLRGKLDFIQRGTTIRSADKIYVFGDVGYLEKDKMRTATVQVASASATYLLFRIDREELNRDPLKELRRRLTTEAFDKFVEDQERTI